MTLSSPAIDLQARPRRHRGGGLALAAAIVGVLVAVPTLGVLAHLLQPSGEEWRGMMGTVLPAYLLNTLWLLLGVGAGTAFGGVVTAWLVVMCRFPGRRFFEWALTLPLAVPAYVLAYVYADFLQFTGPVQTALRDLLGWQAGDYWFPDIRSPGGAIVLLSVALYPYVYLLARAAFVEQSVCAIDASRTLGASATETFFRVALPLARPAIAAGVALALMETLADFGAVAYLDVPTFTTGIYRAWFSFGDKVAAAQLAAALLLFALGLLLVERASRASRRFHQATQRYRALPTFHLSGLRAAAATLVCAVPLLVGFALPVVILLRFALLSGDAQWGRRYLGLTLNSVMVAALVAVIAVALATIIAYAARGARRAPVRWIARLAGMGYAVPGAVIAVGILAPLALFDNALDAWMRAALGVSTGLLLTGSIVGIVYACVVRFLAAGMQSIEAGLARITPGIDGASRTLGAGPLETLRRIHRPLLQGGLASAALIVFVDTMKELPATLMLRPFNFDTLAVQAYNLARDERLAEASTAALTIVAVGVLPIVLLTRAALRARPGHPR
ncbi:iron ABC transporter permease [Vineibacter terrae]|uniref:Iron ABC transporter permease n=1 Tax=Vineibacter terrae TaxID=2586908 RepID=A0A5C8PG22_9HYPH|nr:iron ABC transporter permease [Vineibacter terrae]TXL72121.1 iron ABC transporter permease [Vineibacter terrae]